jgi:hypothetical protein
MESETTTNKTRSKAPWRISLVTWLSSTSTTQEDDNDDAMAKTEASSEAAVAEVAGVSARSS